MSSETISYFNIEISNTSKTPIKCEQSNVFSNDILRNINKYYGSIVRMNINQILIPLFICKVQEPVNDINLTIYSFTLEYNNQHVQVYLNWFNNSTNVDIPSTGTTTQQKTNYYYCNSYNHFITMMNTALKSAHEQLAALVGGATINPAKYPYILYENSVLSLVCPLEHYDSNAVGNYVKIYCNTELSPFMHGFQLANMSYSNANGMDYLINVQTLPDAVVQSNVSNNYITMTQEASCLSYWNSLRKIYVMSNLNIVSETFYNKTGSLQYENILTDFIPDLTQGSESLVVQKQTIYSASSLWRLFKFTGNTSLRTLNISLKWADNDGSLYDIYLPYGFKIDLKLMFVPEELVSF